MAGKWKNRGKKDEIYWIDLLHFDNTIYGNYEEIFKRNRMPKSTKVPSIKLYALAYSNLFNGISKLDLCN